MTRARTFDGEAVKLLLDGEPQGSPKWKALTDKVQVVIGKRCPFCNSDRVESAGGFGSTAYRCEECDEQWESDEIADLAERSSYR